MTGDKGTNGRGKEWTRERMDDGKIGLKEREPTPGRPWQEEVTESMESRDGVSHVAMCHVLWTYKVNVGVNGAKSLPMVTGGRMEGGKRCGAL